MRPQVRRLDRQPRPGDVPAVSMRVAVGAGIEPAPCGVSRLAIGATPTRAHPPADDVGVEPGPFRGIPFSRRAWRPTATSSSKRRESPTGDYELLEDDESRCTRKTLAHLSDSVLQNSHARRLLSRTPTSPATQLGLVVVFALTSSSRRSPTEEAADSRSARCEFDSRRRYAVVAQWQRQCVERASGASSTLAHRTTAFVAQLVAAPGSEPVQCEFESRRRHDGTLDRYGDGRGCRPRASARVVRFHGVPQ